MLNTGALAQLGERQVRNLKGQQHPVDVGSGRTETK